MADGCSDGRMRPLVKASGSHDERVTPHFPATLEVEMGGFDRGGCSPDEVGLEGIEVALHLELI